MTAVRAIAAAQTIPTRGDVDANVEQHLRLVRVAAEERAEVLVFPELSLTGYELDLASGLAFPEHDPRLAPLVDAASSMTVVMANFGGPSGGLASAGRSAIWSEKGGLLAQLDQTGAGTTDDDRHECRDQHGRHAEHHEHRRVLSARCRRHE